MASPAGDLPTFDALPLSVDVRRAVDELGYVHPTPVQLAVFEPAVRGKDLVVQARTGTGKTASFGLPLVDGIVKKGTGAVQALVLCPTRELALQVTREVDALAKHRGIRCAAVYGGAPMAKQIADIRAGAQIVVGTPGRVLDHLHRGTLDPQAIRVFVLDESDEMLSMGFLPQISDILGFLPETRQTLLFSATLPPDIQRVAKTRLKSPEFLTLSGDHIGALEINHYVYVVPSDKLGALIQIIEVENPESAIVFCNTKDETKRVAAALEQQGYAADWLNADLPQSDREKVMAATRKGELRFLVATDVASRGIDISLLTHVINYDFPESAEAYVHRTGRTGRAGRTGTAIALIGPRDVGNLYLLRLTYKLKPIERQLPSAREKKTREEADLLRMFADAFATRRTHPDDLALARRLLTHEDAEAIIAGLLRDHLGARPDALDEATAARRARTTNAEPPEPAPAAPRAEARREGRRHEGRGDGPRHEGGRADGQRPDAGRGDGPRPDAGRRDGPRTEGSRRDEPRRGDRSRRGERRRESQAERHATPIIPAGIDDNDDDLPGYVATPLPAEHAVAVPATSTQGDPSATSGAPAKSAPRAASKPQDDVEGADEGAEPTGEVSANEIYVSVGRRDGAKPSDFQTVLSNAGIGPESTEYIRVRHRHAFVSVSVEKLDQALSALNGAVIAGRRANAERARRA
ncbi:MAG TPA: DEAD/DEAH box helicase [Polyangiaceae bacterium]|nr:DEAD/DEAH box helicase [Polyangiaceae bacterium]